MRTHFCGLVDEALIGQTVTLCGWADVARNLGGVCFIDLRDHEGIVQVVAESGYSAEVFAGRRRTSATSTACGSPARCARGTASTTRSRTGQVEVVADAHRDPQQAPSRCRSMRTRTPARKSA